MRLTSYSALLTQVSSLLNIAAADVTAADGVKINAFLQRRAREAFQFYWWPETMRIEERFYRAPYASGTTYAASTATAPTEVYDPASRAYYQCLRAATGQAPATLSGTSYTTNTAYWSPVGESYGGSDWADATAYAVAATVRNPADGLYYRCHTAHTSATTLDATKFGLLVDWTAYISLDQADKTPIGLVRGCYLDHPGRVRNPRRVGIVLGPDGIYLPDTRTTSVFTWFQVRAPLLSGSAYSAGTAYAAGVVMYYTSGTVGYEGDHWLCASATSAGQTPETHPAKWTRQEIPENLRDAIAHAAYGDFLRPAGKSADVPMETSEGAQFLTTEIQKYAGMQRQAGRWTQT